MIDFKFMDYAFNIQSDYLIILGSVILGGIILGTILFSISSLIGLFCNIINK